MKKSLYFNDLAGGGGHFLGKILLAFVSTFSLISTANATCNPPIGKCECAYPIIENGSLKCNPQSYCPSDTECMPDGSCCPEANFCQVGNSKYCCAENETCDTNNGCLSNSCSGVTACSGVADGTACCTESGESSVCYQGNCSLLQCTSDQKLYYGAYCQGCYFIPWGNWDEYGRNGDIIDELETNLYCCSNNPAEEGQKGICCKSGEVVCALNCNMPDGEGYPAKHFVCNGCPDGQVWVPLVGPEGSEDDYTCRAPCPAGQEWRTNYSYNPTCKTTNPYLGECWAFSCYDIISG